jgi:hypothetical protein
VRGTDATVRCECSHLTSFIGTIGASYSGFANVYGVAGNLRWSDFSKVQVLLWVLGGIYLFAILFMVRDGLAMRIQQRRLAQKVWNSIPFQNTLESLRETNTEYIDPEACQALDLKAAQDKARFLESGRVQALLTVQDNVRPSFRHSMTLYVEALASEHKLIAAFTNAEPSFTRAPVALLDLVTFLFAIAVMEVRALAWAKSPPSGLLTTPPPCVALTQNTGEYNTKLEYLQWAKACAQGIFTHSCTMQLRGDFLSSLQETIILAAVASFPRAIIGSSLETREANRQLNKTWEEKLEIDGLVCINPSTTHSSVDVRRAQFSAEAAFRVVHRLNSSAEDEELLGDYVEKLSRRHKKLGSATDHEEVNSFPVPESRIEAIRDRIQDTCCAKFTPRLDDERHQRDEEQKEWTRVILGSLPLEQVIAHVQEQVCLDSSGHPIPPDSTCVLIMIYHLVARVCARAEDRVWAGAMVATRAVRALHRARPGPHRQGCARADAQGAGGHGVRVLLVRDVVHRAVPPPAGA